MPYTAPGVYYEEVVIQPEVSLPTGIPGFIGFATKVTATLEKLPEEIQFALESLKDTLSYEQDHQRLIFTGIMSTNKRDELLALSPNNQAFKKAVENLFKNAQYVVALNSQQEFAEKFHVASQGSESYLKEAVTGFFENGGTRCYVVPALLSTTQPSDKDKKEALLTAINALALLIDIDLVAIPDVMTLSDKDAIYEVQQAAIKHCAKYGDRFAILDALPEAEAESVSKQWDDIKKNQTEEELRNGALYYPWLRNAQGRWVPPCGHIAGIFARSDRTRGVFKAPANEEVRGAVDLQFPVDNSVQSDLNTIGINCLRAFPARGIRVWGARTLSNDPNWRYINVRRLFLTLKRWIDLNMGWAVFEPNSLQLWVRIERELSSYLTQLWRAGAFKGETPEQAFYVKCNAETNPPESREAGKVLTEIGFAPTSPAEFIVVRITQRPNTTELTYLE